MNPYRTLAVAVLTQTVLDLKSARAKGLLELDRGRWSLGPAGKTYNRSHRTRYSNLIGAKAHLHQLAEVANSPEFRQLLGEVGLEPENISPGAERPSIKITPRPNPLTGAISAFDRAYRRWERRRGLKFAVPTLLYGSPCN